MILEDRKIISWNDGYWSEDLYYLEPPPKKKPLAIIDEENGFILKPMCFSGGHFLYYKSEL